MSWYAYTGGADMHAHADTDWGYFYTEDTGASLNPGAELRRTVEMQIPRAGRYAIQFDCCRPLELTVNGRFYHWEEALNFYGMLPELEFDLPATVVAFNVELRNPDSQPHPSRFRLRLIDGAGRVVRPNEKLDFPAPAEPAAAFRSAPDLTGFTPGIGAALRSVGRFGFTKGDGALDYSMPKFGIVARPYVSGHPDYRKNRLWHFSLLADRDAETGSLRTDYVPGPEETVRADWSGVRWSKRDLTLDYSLLSPTLLIENFGDTLFLRDLESASAFHRAVLGGTVDRSDCDGVFYDRTRDGELTENWVMFYGADSFPEVPVQVILPVSPRRIAVRRRPDGGADCIQIEFDSAPGWAQLAFPLGLELLEPDSFPAALERTVNGCRRRARTALCRPVACAEYFRVCEAEKRVEIVQCYCYRDFADAFGTVPLKMSPLPPVLALAALHSPAVTIDPAAEDCEFPTKYGPFFAVRNSDCATCSVPLPDSRRSFALQSSQHRFDGDFEEYLRYHRELNPIPNPGVHQFLFPYLIPLLTFHELNDSQRERLLRIVGENLRKCCDPEFSYTGPKGRRCFAWYRRREPFSGVSYYINYLHVFHSLMLPDCERDTVENSEVPFIEVDWGNGMALYSIYLAALFTNDLTTVRRAWPVLRGAFDYFLNTCDWACLTAAYCENGRAWNDGANYGAYLGFMNLAELTGNRAEWELGAYAYGKMVAGRIALLNAGPHYFPRYFGNRPWFTAKTFGEETTCRAPHAAYPADTLHGQWREQALYNITTEGQYPEALDMVAAYAPAIADGMLGAVEACQPDGLVTGPIPPELRRFHTGETERLGEHEIYDYLYLAYRRGRFDAAAWRRKLSEAARNHRLSREFLGTSFSCRRVPAAWTAVFLGDLAECDGQVKLKFWKNLRIEHVDYPELTVAVPPDGGELEISAPGPVSATLNGAPLTFRDGRAKIPESGVIRFESAETRV